MRKAVLWCRQRNPFRDWYSKLTFYWYTRDRGELAFFTLLGLPFLALGFTIYTYVTAQNHNHQLLCLALNVYHEARGEPLIGQYAVAEVTMNRVASAAYPGTVCEVVYQKNWDRLRRRYVGAFSWTEFDSTPPIGSAAWLQAWAVAEAVYYEREAPRLKGALHYHARHVRPSWARGREPLARIGKHVFYE